jgi:hypothetical protein
MIWGKCMKYWLSLLLFVPALLAQSIVPDASFQGWTRLAFPPGGPLDPVSQWKVDPAKGILICEGNRGHEWLRYDLELANFVLHAEWRFTPVEGGKGYNSGIFVRNSADGKIWHQAQVGSASGGFLFGNTLVNGVPQRFNLRSEMKENRVKPAGEWNAYDIRCDGRVITVSVNGGVTSQFSACEIPKGYIGLEAEGYRIEFRNLRLSPLR